MRDVILVEEIIKQMAVPRAGRGHHPQADELLVALQSLAAHDERADDRFAHARQFGQRLPQRGGGDFEDFGFLRTPPRAGDGTGAVEHRHVAHEIARTRRGEDLFDAIACFESLDLTG